MATRRERAVEKRSKGYNCAQAVACTYCDLAGVDEEMIFRMAEGFGHGMGNLEGTCGAIAGACLLAGLVNSTGNLEAPDSKAATGQLSKRIMECFQERNRAVSCKDLKGIETGVMLRSCPDCIRDASEFVEEILFSDHFLNEK